MPELPEVETIRRDLVRKVANKKIVHVDVRQAKAVAGMKTKFVHLLTGNRIRAIERRGKLMLWRLALPRQGIDTALVHLKMTGQLIYEKKRDGIVEVVAGGHRLTERDFDLPNSHTQVILTFGDMGKLFFNDLRRFGYMKPATAAQAEAALDKFGPEPLGKDFTWQYFQEIFFGKKTSVKALLLNQELIAGLGNIYVDEACFCAGVRPERRVGLLTPTERRKLFLCIPRILKNAIKHRGTTFKDYLDSEGKRGNYSDFLMVFDRDGQSCRRCGTVIKKTRAAGRGTHFCPTCQR